MTILEEAKDLKTAVVFMGDRGCKRTGVLGESLGGAVSVMAHNDEIDCLVLWYSALYLKSTLLKLLLAKGHRREPEEKGYVTWVREDGRKLRIWVGFIEEVKKLDITSHLKEIKCPTMIVNGDKDTIVPYSGSVKAMKLMETSSELVNIEGAEHCFARERRILSKCR